MMADNLKSFFDEFAKERGFDPSDAQRWRLIRVKDIASKPVRLKIDTKHNILTQFYSGWIRAAELLELWRCSAQSIPFAAGSAQTARYHGRVVEQRITLRSWPTSYLFFLSGSSSRISG